MAGAKKAPFVDAQAVHRVHPGTFEVPDKATLARIEPGWLVKASAHGERFWIRITDVGPGGRMTGRVEDSLVTPLLRRGDTVALRRKHVYDVIEPPGRHCSVQ